MYPNNTLKHRTRNGTLRDFKTRYRKDRNFDQDQTNVKLRLSVLTSTVYQVLALESPCRIALIQELWGFFVFFFF